MNSQACLEDSMGWCVVGAKVKGSAHERIGLPCQDAYAYQVMSDDLLLISVADGAGSASLAEVGSHLAAHESVRLLSGHLTNLIGTKSSAWEELLRRSFRETLAILKQEAKGRGCTLRDLSTTLILMAAGPDQAACLQIGDGAVVIANQAGGMSILSVPQQGEYLNQTIFLTSDEAVEMAKFSLVQDQLGFVSVFSDGLQQLALKMPDYQPYPGFFEPLWRFAASSQGAAEPKSQELAAFLDSPRLNKRTDDDKTLVLATLKRS